MKLILVLLLAGTAGCSALPGTAKSLADSICEATPAKRIVLASQADRLTKPHKVRVICGEDQ